MKKNYSFFLQSLLLNLAWFSSSLLLADQKYEISDDFIIDNVLSGAFGAEYASRAPYINRLLGELLAFLNRCTSGFSVFFVFQLTVSLLSFTALTYILLTRNRPAVGLCLSAVLLLFFTDDYYILVCCTRTASLAAAAGGALFLHALFPPENEPLSLPALLSGGFLALIGFLIRVKSALLVLPFLFIVFIGAAMGTALMRSDASRDNQKPGIRPRSAARLLAPLALLALAALLHLASSALNAKDPAYASYLTFDNRRSSVVDTASFGYESVKGAFDSLGLSLNDYYMLRSWNFNDREIFTDEVLDTIAEAQDKVRFERTLNLRYLLEDALTHRFHTYACIPGLLLMFAFFIYSRRHIPYAVMTLLLGAALFLVLEILGRPVYRVTSAILIAEAVTLAAAPSIVPPEKKREPLRVRAAVFILIILMLLTRQVFRPQDKYWTYADDESYRYWAEMAFMDSDSYVASKYTFDISHRGPDRNLIAAIDADRDHYYLLDFTSLIQRAYYNYPHMKRLPENYYIGNYGYLGGVLTNFPPVNEDLASRGLDPDSLVRSVADGNVLVVDNNLYEFRLRYLREHYYPNARMEQAGEIDGFKIWRYFSE